MIARIRKSMEEKDQGFTLIELLVVMIIIGILAAIAIPVFLNQRKSAHDTAIKSDLRTAATEIEADYVTNQAYPTTDDGNDLIADEVELSEGVVLAYTLDADSLGYCILGTNASAGHSWVYDSSEGGLQDADSTC